MAFRASTRKNTKKSTEPAVEPSSPLSIEDVVGAPVQETPPSEPTPPVSEPRSEPREEKKEEKPETVMTSEPARSGGYRRNDRPRGGFSMRSHSQGGFRRPGGGGNFRTGGYRREWGGNNSAPRADHDAGGVPPREQSFTQDIDVPTETVKGILDTMPEGHGFLRPKFTPSDRDVYISQSQIRRFLLRNGDMVQGQARPPKDNERYWGLLKVENVNGMEAETLGQRARFDDLTPIYPNRHLKLETEGGPMSTRMIDLVAPIGFGQRGLIVSPPKAGKTTILKELASGIAANYPDVHLMAALIGERPEEVTDLSRNIKGEVLASNFDQSPAEQTRIAEVALDRAKRLVEMGKDVVVLLDSITRLARAYNLVVNPSGRTLSGGFDPAALYPAKRFLGAARCVESGGSLTVIGTSLVDTGSRMDDLIYEEFKGTGNMELHLSRVLQERRIFPAIDLTKSGTRHDELLLGEEAMKRVITLRHMLSLLGDEERTLMVIERLSKTKTNEEFLASLAQG